MAAQTNEDIAALMEQRKHNLVHRKLVNMMYADGFFRSLLPYMEELKVLPKKKVDQLLDQSEEVVESSLSTRELMQLAVKWEITESAAQFWREHKSKAELILELRKRKAELEYVPPEKDAGPVEVEGLTDRLARNDTQQTRVQKRRSSLANLGTVVEAQEYTGDKFSQRGDYLNGIMYSMRRRSMDPAGTGESGFKFNGLSKEQWEELKNTDIGDDSPSRPTGASDSGDEDDEFRSRPATQSAGRSGEGGDGDHHDAAFQEQLQKVGESLQGASPAGKGKFVRDASRTAGSIQGFISDREKTMTIKRPPLEGKVLDIEGWVERNAGKHDDPLYNKDDVQRMYATGAVSKAMGIDSLIIPKEVEVSFGAKKPKVDYGEDIDYVVEGVKDMMSKSLRGVSGEMPQPSPVVANRGKSKIDLYHKPMEHQEPSAVRLTPRVPEQKTLPPMMTDGPAEPGSMDDKRYGLKDAPQHIVAAATGASPSRGGTRRHRSGANERYPTRNLSATGGDRGPIPSPMMLPTPSHTIMQATTGTGTGVMSGGSITDYLNASM